MAEQLVWDPVQGRYVPASKGVSSTPAPQHAKNTGVAPQNAPPPAAAPPAPPQHPKNTGIAPQNAPPPPSTWVSFDQGDTALNPSTAVGGASDFADYLFNSMTPEQQDAFIAKGLAEQRANGGYSRQAPDIAYEASGGDSRYVSPEIAALGRAGKRFTDANLKNQEELIKLQLLAERGGEKNQAAVDEMGRLIDAQDPRNATFVQQSRDLATELGGYRDTANKGSLDALGRYDQELSGYTASNKAAISDLDEIYGQLKTPLTANLTSQAAIADPAILAQQQQALSFLGGVSGGSLDYASQAAGAYADPKYVAMRDQGLEDLYGVSKGSKDVLVGQADPKAYAQAMEALDQASALTNPAVTDKENFLYEQARQTWESEMRGVAQAKMSDLRRRGMGGSGAELTQGALTNADVSQKRVLADLAASAGAVDRSSDMLKLKGALSTQLNAEGNALATGNANRQLQALGLYQQGAETAQQSSFDQEYKRGVAADNASANNQSTRLQGGIAHGQQANAMQEQHYNRGMAADTMARYNKTFEQDERDALWGRTTDRTGMTLSANAQNSNNSTNIFQGATSVFNNNYQRDRDVVSGKDLANVRENAGYNQQTDRRLAAQGAQIGINDTDFDNKSGVIGQNIGENRWLGTNLASNDTSIAGQHAADRAALSSGIAAIDADEAASKEGIFGLPYIGSDKGLLNLFGAFDESADSKKAKLRSQYPGA